MSRKTLILTTVLVMCAVLFRASDSAAASGITNPLGMDFVYIAPGVFTMGSPASEPGRDADERQHRVTLTRGFYMMTTEVTQGQWKAVMGTNPSRFKNCGDDCPVESVSWNDVQQFIEKLNRMGADSAYRLPTEAEWEYAARAGSKTALYTGQISIVGRNNSPQLHPIAWYSGNSCVAYSGAYDCAGWDETQYSCRRCGTRRVGRKKPNAWGLYDVIGNVREWCQDRYGGYPGGSVSDPTGPSTGANRVLRGGSWSSLAKYCRSANRGRHETDFKRHNLGFRLCRDGQPSPE